MLESRNFGLSQNQKVFDGVTGGMRKAALYARVSTQNQTTENQVRELIAVADTQNWDVVDVFLDEAISGAKGRDGRPGLDAMLEGVQVGQFDLVAAWSVDRLGRSLIHLETILSVIRENGVDLYLHQQGVDTSTPAGKAMFQMMGVFAEFERAMIAERIKAGLERAKENGKVIGRPPLAQSVREAICEMLQAKRPKRQIAKKYGVSRATVSNIEREPWCDAGEDGSLMAG